MNTSPPSPTVTPDVNRMSTLDGSTYFGNGRLVSEQPAEMQSSGRNNGLTRPKRELKMRDVVTFWGLLIIFLASGVAIAFGIMSSGYSATDFERYLPKDYKDGIYLLGTVETLNIPERTLSVQWIAYQCSNVTGCHGLTEATRFYLDKNATLSSDFDEDSAVEVFEPSLNSSIINVAICQDLNQERTTPECWDTQVKNGVPYEQTISTDHKFSVRPARSWRSLAQAYPFDMYEVRSTFLALEGDRNNSRHFLGASISGTIPNFSVKLRSLRFTSDQQPFEWMMMTISVQRAEIVVGFAFLIWIINWLMTGVVMWITIAAVQGRRRIPDHLFAVPVVALFALPTVRQSMPGGPGFGCILDYCGIILNLAVLVICSVVLLICAIARDAREFYPPSKSLLVEKYKAWKGSRAGTTAD